MDTPIEHSGLYRSELVHIVDVSCRIHRSSAGGEESTAAFSVVFPRRGCYTRHLGRRRELADACTALFFRRDEAYRISHPVAGGDDSTALNFSEAVLDEAFFSPGGRSSSFPATQCEIGLELNRRLQVLRHHARAGSTAIEIDEQSLCLLSGVAAAVSGESRLPNPKARHRTRKRQRQLVDRARELLHENLDRTVTLAGISRTVGSSPYHLTRLFRSYTGQPMHRYLTHLRMTKALERLMNGEADLSRLAGDLGYASHAHFTESFRRCFGQPPSKFRLDPAIGN